MLQIPHSFSREDLKNLVPRGTANAFLSVFAWSPFLLKIFSFDHGTCFADEPPLLVLDVLHCYLSCTGVVELRVSLTFSTLASRY